MKRIITQEQIEAIIQAFRATNISFANGEAIVKFFQALPLLKEDLPEKKTPNEK